MKKHLIYLALFSVMTLALVKLSPDNSASANSATAPSAEAPSRLSPRITVQKNERLASFINLRDGFELISSYDGPSRLALEQNEVKSLALATADFDEDGMPDLASGHVGIAGFLVTLRRGNVDAVYPNSPEAKLRKAEGQFTEAPFLSDAKSFSLPAVPDLLGAGDFDADGHWDLVAAQKGNDALYFMRGDGRGGFGPAQRIMLGGDVTALSTGEMNRADGLTDIAVSIVGTDGAQALVFEGPEGALKRQPERYALPAAASSLELGQLDSEYPFDLAVAAGSNLLIVHGRDRRLSVDEPTRSRVAPAVVDQQTFPFIIVSMTVGDFVPRHEYREDIALMGEDGRISLLERDEQSGQAVTHHTEWRLHEAMDARAGDGGPGIPDAPEAQLLKANTSSLRGDDLLVIDRRQQRILVLACDSAAPAKSPRHLLAATLVSGDEPVAVLPMRLNVDALKDLIVLTSEQSAPFVMLTEPRITAVVSNTSDSGPGSFREALATGGSITFAIPGAPPYVIDLFSALPPVTGVSGVTIDGTTQPGYAGTPIIVLTTTHNVSTGLDIRAGSSTIRGIVMNRFLNLILLTDVGSNVIEGNYLGVAPDGSTYAGNNGSGVQMTNSSGNVIGGTVPSARNVASMATAFLLLGGGTSTGNLIRGNYININAAGTTRVIGGSVGITLFSQSGNTIGGTTAGTRNVISGGNVGVRLSATSSNLLQGNYIGPDATGTSFVGAGIANVISSNSPHLIGGTTPAARNIISGNQDPLGNGNPGVSIGTEGNPPGLLLIQGNYIGTQADGLSPLPNGGGIRLQAGIASIGGTVPGAGNIIAFNRQYGVYGDGSDGGYYATRTIILGNSIHSNVPVSSGGGVGLGIDLQVINGPFGVTPNDPSDLDLGPNNLQNFPVLTSVASTGGSTIIHGSLNSNPGVEYRIEYFSNPSCDPLGNGEGRTYLGSSLVVTGASGDGSIAATLPVVVPGGKFITSTASAISPTSGAPTETSEFSLCVQSTGARAHKASDFDGDGDTDIAVFRPSTGNWHIRETSTGVTITTHWGTSGDVPVPADYDGDGKTDLAVFRPSITDWLILNSSTGAFVTHDWGLATDKLVPADYDGDGKADPAVFRPSTGTWHIIQSSTGTTRSQVWGVTGDKPVPVDYDGDGRADLAVFRPSNGTWYLLNSSDASSRVVTWGLSTDKPVAGDHDGDGRDDIAVWRPGDGTWYIVRSSDGVLTVQMWGLSGDEPQPGDYDGDNRNDFVVRRTSTNIWYLLGTGPGTPASLPFGLTGDVAVSSAYIIE